MLGDVGGGDEDLSERDGIIGEEEEGEVFVGVGILIDNFGDVDDETDGLREERLICEVTSG